MLKDKVVLITGSSSGIGFAAARAALASGAKIIMHGSNLEKLRAAAQALDVPFVEANLSDDDAAERLADRAMRIHGRIDVLVNNAAIFPRTDLQASDGAAFDRIFAINARSPMLLSRRVVTSMRAADIRGSIVNIGSVNAYCGQDDLLVYSMSKGALMTMTRNMADALAPTGIRINQLNVGWTLTEMELETQRALGRPDNWQASIPAPFAPDGRILTPEEVARQIVFWASDDSAPVSGQVYEVEKYPFLGRNILNRLT